jgi:N-acetylglutamate synthase-like GNAT family acetyltransferase
MDKFIIVRRAVFMLLFRQATLQDRPQLFRFFPEGWGEDSLSQLYLIEDAGQTGVVGAVAIETHENIAWVHSLILERPFCQERILTQLISVLLRQAKRLECSKVVVVVDRLREWFQACGFQPGNREEFPPELHKRLSQPRYRDGEVFEYSL